MAAKTLRDSQQLPYGVRILNPAHADPWYGPYDDIAQANLTVPAALRNVDYEAGKYYPRTVGIRTVDGPKEYWWKDNSSDGSLVVKTDGGGGGSGPTSGNLNTVVGTSVNQGGNASQNTVFNLGVFGWLLQRAGVKIEIEQSTGNLLLKTEGMQTITIQSDLGLLLSAPNILLSGLTLDNTKNKIVGIDPSTNRIYRVDLGGANPIVFSSGYGVDVAPGVVSGVNFSSTDDIFSNSVDDFFGTTFSASASLPIGANADEIVFGKAGTKYYSISPGGVRIEWYFDNDATLVANPVPPPVI